MIVHILVYIFNDVKRRRCVTQLIAVMQIIVFFVWTGWHISMVCRSQHTCSSYWLRKSGHFLPVGSNQPGPLKQLFSPKQQIKGIKQSALSHNRSEIIWQNTKKSQSVILSNTFHQLKNPETTETRQAYHLPTRITIGWTVIQLFIMIIYQVCTIKWSTVSSQTLVRSGQIATKDEPSIKTLRLYTH